MSRRAERVSVMWATSLGLLLVGGWVIGSTALLALGTSAADLREEAEDIASKLPEAYTGQGAISSATEFDQPKVAQAWNNGARHLRDLARQARRHDFTKLSRRFAAMSKAARQTAQCIANDANESVNIAFVEDECPVQFDDFASARGALG